MLGKTHNSWLCFGQDGHHQMSHICSKATYLVMEARAKIVGHREKVVRPLSPIPVGVVLRHPANRTPHQLGGFKGQGQPVGRQIAGCVYRSIEPVRLGRVHCPDGAVKVENHTY